MFNNWGVSGVVILSLVAFTIIAFLINWLRKEPSKMVQVSLGFIIGGALGNVIDRVRLGAVFDFLDFSIGEYHWPAFNVADSFICIGAILVIMHGMLVKSSRKSNFNRKGRQNEKNSVFCGIGNDGRCIVRLQQRERKLGTGNICAKMNFSFNQSAADASSGI